MDTPKKEGLRGPEIDVDAMHLKFMASPHIEWTKFADSVGIDSARSRPNYPVATWQDEKRKVIAMREAETLAQMLFDRRFKWHKDVLKTLNDYPESNDIMHQLIKLKMQEYAQIARDDQDKKPEFAEETLKNGKVRKVKIRRTYKDVTTAELSMLAQALKGVTEAKYKSLLLNDWNVKMASTEAERDTEKDVTGAGLQVTVDGKEMGLKEIESMVSRYYEQK